MSIEIEKKTFRFLFIYLLFFFLFQSRASMKFVRIFEKLWIRKWEKRMQRKNLLPWGLTDSFISFSSIGLGLFLFSIYLNKQKAKTKKRKKWLIIKRN